MNRILLDKIDGPGAHSSWMSMADFYVCHWYQQLRYRLRTMRRIKLIMLCIALCLPLAGCPSQNTIAALVSILGSSAASIASVQGNASLAQKLEADTTAAETAVRNWKQGTSAQNAIQALNLVEDDLNLFPIGKYGPLIDLAIGTAESIIAMLPQDASAPHAMAPHAHRRAVTLAQPAPKTAKAYKAQFNALVKAYPAIPESVLIK